MKLQSVFSQKKKLLFSTFITSALLSISFNSAASEQILEKYDLGGGEVFFVNPTDRANKSTVVDYFVAQCDHSEFSNSNEKTQENTTTHLVTLSLVPCERTQLSGVKARPVPDDMVVDTFDGIVKFNRESKGSSQIINGNLYKAASSEMITIGSEVIDISSLSGSSQDLQKIAQEVLEAQARIEKLKATCEAVKMAKVTESLSGNSAKAEQIISSLSNSGEGHARMQSALEQNAGKCVRTFPGKVIPNEVVSPE